MTREIKADFQDLIEFIKSYELHTFLQNDYFTLLKPVHKKFFSLMTITVEIEFNTPKLDILPNEGLVYLKESVSDIGQTLFCWIHGLYKPSNLLLRSGIETFIKSLSSIEEPNILYEKSVYKVFEIAKNTSFFSSELGNYYFGKLYFIYKELCKIVHSAGLSTMSQITALNTFPNFSFDHASLITNDLIKVMMKHDLEINEKELYLKNGGYKIKHHYE